MCKIIFCIIKRVGNFALFDLSINEILLVIQKQYYANRISELEKNLIKNRSFVNSTEKTKIKNDFETLSKTCFEKVLYEKYNSYNK